MAPLRSKILALASLRVLVVEDDYFLADDLARLLDERGATVVGPVGTVDHALTILGDLPVDCAVVDINLNGQRAFGVAGLLRERSIPFVFATGYDPDVVPEAFADVALYRKPFDADELIEGLVQARGGAAKPPRAMAPRPIGA